MRVCVEYVSQEHTLHTQARTLEGVRLSVYSFSGVGG